MPRRGLFCFPVCICGIQLYLHVSLVRISHTVNAVIDAISNYVISWFRFRILLPELIWLVPCRLLRLDQISGTRIPLSDCAVLSPEALFCLLNKIIRQLAIFSGVVQLNELRIPTDLTILLFGPEQANHVRRRFCPRVDVIDDKMVVNMLRNIFCCHDVIRRE